MKNEKISGAHMVQVCNAWHDLRAMMNVPLHFVIDTLQYKDLLKIKLFLEQRKLGTSRLVPK